MREKVNDARLSPRWRRGLRGRFLGRCHIPQNEEHRMCRARAHTAARCEGCTTHTMDWTKAYDGWGGCEQDQRLGSMWHSLGNMRIVWRRSSHTQSVGLSLLHVNQGVRQAPYVPLPVQRGISMPLSRMTRAVNSSCRGATSSNTCSVEFRPAPVLKTQRELLDERRAYFIVMLNC